MKAILQSCIDVEERVGEIDLQLVEHPEAGAPPDLQTTFKSPVEVDRGHTARLRSCLKRLNDGAGPVFDDGGMA
jgi:hypothetical protein